MIIRYLYWSKDIAYLEGWNKLLIKFFFKCHSLIDSTYTLKSNMKCQISKRVFSPPCLQTLKQWCSANHAVLPVIDRTRPNARKRACQYSTQHTSVETKHTQATKNLNMGLKSDVKIDYLKWKHVRTIITNTVLCVFICVSARPATHTS